MEVLRLYDPGRRPPDWTNIIRPGQFAAFSKQIDGGGSCDAEGRPFASSADVTCVLFDRLQDARAFCEARVQVLPSLRFEIFDSAGRTNPPILIVVHPSRTSTLDANPRGMRARKVAAIVLAVGAVPLFLLDYLKSGGLMIFPTVLGINMILIAARLMQLNASYADAERRRRARLAQVDRGEGGVGR
jgi:hypothetical protein